MSARGYALHSVRPQLSFPLFILRVFRKYSSLNGHVEEKCFCVHVRGLPVHFFVIPRLPRDEGAYMKIFI